MIDPTLLAQAKRGEVSAIASLLGQSLRPQGIWVRAESQDGNRRIILESTQPPDADAMERRVRAGLERLQPDGIEELTLCGWALGDVKPAWERQIVLVSAVQPPPLTGRRSSSSPGGKNFTQLNSTPLNNDLTKSRSSACLSDALPEPLPMQATHHKETNRPVVHRSRVNRMGQRRSSQLDSRKQPFILKWSDFDPVMLTIIGFIAIYGFCGSLNPSYDGPFIWLHYPDLAIHETGHLLFMPFGRFLMLLGGSLTQILFPAAFTFYFYVSRQYFSSALTLFWTGQNFMDVAVYMRDAPIRILPLTVDNIDAHDWWQLFRMMGSLHHAGFIAGVTHGVGVLLYIASVVAGCYFAYQSHQNART
ncbi:MAG: hypothetical protein ACFBSF_05365 [Leptolyngbyaceae cyanobacterium]